MFGGNDGTNSGMDFSQTAGGGGASGHTQAMLTGWQEVSDTVRGEGPLLLPWCCLTAQRAGRHGDKVRAWTRTSSCQLGPSGGEGASVLTSAPHARHDSLLHKQTCVFRRRLRCRRAKLHKLVLFMADRCFPGLPLFRFGRLDP